MALPTPARVASRPTVLVSDPAVTIPEDTRRRLLRRASSGSLRSARVTLPPELLESARARVRLVGLLFLIAGAVVQGVDVLVDGVDALLGAPEGVAQLLLTVLAGVLYAYARAPRVTPQRVLNAALSFEIAVCLLVSLMAPRNAYAAAVELGALDHLTDLFPFVTWTVPIIIMFPLIVPSPPRTTLWVALAAAATTPLGLALLDLTTGATVELRAYPHTLVSPAIAVAAAYFGSRMVYGLGLDVTRAREMGSYRLTELLGRGGMGEVWKAEHRMLARPAAIKLVRPDVFGAAGSEQARMVLARFEREAQVTATLRSPHTIELYDFGSTADGTFYYVAELLEGFDCDALIKRFGPLPAGRALHLLIQVCDSLGEAHARGLIHRDIKPANVFVCRYGRQVDFVKVLDFGLVKPNARDTDHGAALTADGMVSGTPAFMAPEQVLGDRTLDPRADLYAVGCLAYWLLTGALVFEGATAMEIMIHHARTEPTRPSDRTELPLPASLDDVILNCLAKDPARRPGSADELSARLNDCARELAAWTPRAAAWWDTHAPVRDQVAAP